jgi:hypothetical protein
LRFAGDRATGWPGPGGDGPSAVPIAQTRLQEEPIATPIASTITPPTATKSSEERIEMARKRLRSHAIANSSTLVGEAGAADQARDRRLARCCGCVLISSTR